MAALKTFLALALLGVVLAQEGANSKICTDDDPLLEHGGMYRINEFDCSQYYVCVFNRAFLKNCSRGTMYDKDKGICTFCDTVECGNRYADPAHCFREVETTVDANATTTPGPTPPSELLGASCKDSRDLTRYALTNTTKEFMNVADDKYEIVSCGHDEFSIADCDCVRPGVLRAKRKEVLLNCEGTVTESSKTWVGVYGNVSLEDYNAQAGETSCRFFAGHLEIPYFMNRAFRRFTIAFFYIRDTGKGGRMGLVNNGRAEVKPAIQLYSEVNGLGGTIITNSSEYSFYIDGTGNVPGLEDGVWQHVAMTFNGSLMTLYINGQERRESVLDGEPRQLRGTPMVIGVDRYSDVTEGLLNTYFVGMMDNIVFYDVDLDPASIARLSNREDVPSPKPDQYN